MTSRPSAEQIMERLLPNSTSETAETPEFQNGLSTRTFLTIPISDLQTYDKNPRRLANPNFEQIKQSILNDGINQPLVVTQRPGTHKFMIYKGGNTRLKAVQELYRETGDRKYRFIDCSFHPWSGFESDAIVGHLQENEMRKSLCFIDRAYGTKIAIEHLKMESGETDLTLRDYLLLLAKKGYSTTLSTLSIMMYAVENIEPQLQRDVCTTMGRPQIQKLRSLEKAFQKVCKEFVIPASTTKILFDETLQTYDDLRWSIRVFRRSLEYALANFRSVSIQDISLRLDGYLHISDYPLNESPETINKEYAKFDQIDWPDTRTNLQHKSDVYSVNKGNDPIETHKNSASEQKITKSSDIEATRLRTDIHAPIFPFSSVDSKLKPGVELELQKLRQESYQIAWQLAKRFDFHENLKTNSKIVKNVGNWGIGFLIADYPAPASGVNMNRIGTRDALWWLLLELSDLQWAAECARPLVAKIIGTSGLHHYVKSGNSKTLHFHARKIMKCTYPHLGLLSYCFRQLDDNSWNDVNHLTRIYRTLHHLSKSQSIHLFQHPKNGGRSK